MELSEELRNQIGDGQLPNKYFVFEYDTKFIRTYENFATYVDAINTETPEKQNFLGVFNTYDDAVICAENESSLSNVMIEDRISGTIYETQEIICSCCGKTEYETNINLEFTKKKLGSDFE